MNTEVMVEINVVADKRSFTEIVEETQGLINGMLDDVRKMKEEAIRYDERLKQEEMLLDEIKSLLKGVKDNE